MYDSIPFAYAFFLRKPLKFEAVIDVINAGGDTDSNAAIVGSLQGALLGKAYLPPEYLRGVNNPEPILASVDRFCKAFKL